LARSTHGVGRIGDQKSVAAGRLGKKSEIGERVESVARGRRRDADQLRAAAVLYMVMKESELGRVLANTDS
jgi:hypothetical protein